jgi:hypothetical protein
MIEEVLYKVLWVEDDRSIIQGYLISAEENGIELDVANSWEEAEEKLRINFNEYSAIILDAQCKLKKNDTVATKLFLGHVSVRMARTFGEKHKFIPWYVLSAGTMDDFGIVLDLINTEERKSFDVLWGKLRYIKGVEEKELYANIKKIAESSSVNTVLFRHADVFKYIGIGRVFDYVKARTYILKMLSALYYPEESLNFIYDGNPLRKVLEYLFRGANKHGLLPDECFDSKGNLILLDASRFMGGLDTNVYEARNIKYKIRYGIQGTGKDGIGGDSVFSEDVAMFVKNILNFSNTDSHTDKEEPYVIDEDKKEIFFGYLLQLCHVIKYLGEFIDSHSNIEENKSKIRIIPINTTDNIIKKEQLEAAKIKYEGKIFTPEKDEEGFWHCGECTLVIRFLNVGDKIKLRDVTNNTNEKTKVRYPYFAYFDKIEE